MGNDASSCFCGDDERRGKIPVGSKRTSHGSMSSTNLSMLEYRPIGEFVIYLGHVTNVKKTHWNSSDSNCYVDIHLESQTNFISPLYRSTVRSHTLSPVWNSYITFPIRPNLDDKVVISLIDSFGMMTTVIGTLEITISELMEKDISLANQLRQFTLNTSDTNDTLEDTYIYLSLLRNKPNLYCRPYKSMIKNIFLIRHGESVWNEGKRDSNVIKLVGNKDHSLNERGIQQAIDLNKKWKLKLTEKLTFNDGHVSQALSRSKSKKILMGSPSNEDEGYDLFLDAECILCSPMTRAAQTALIGLRDHPAFDKGKNMTFCRSLRERKSGIGCFDCIGIESGDGILKRVQDELLKRIPASSSHVDSKLGLQLTKEDVDQIMLPPVDVNDCVSSWWTPPSSCDSDDMISSRCSELWKTLKYSNEKSIILVGHSTFFHELVQTYIHEESFSSSALKKQFCEDIKNHKLDNASCLHIKVKFGELRNEKDGNIIQQAKWIPPKIIDANLLFGKLKGTSTKDRRNTHVE